MKKPTSLADLLEHPAQFRAFMRTYGSSPGTAADPNIGHEAQYAAMGAGPSFDMDSPPPQFDYQGGLGAGLALHGGAPPQHQSLASLVAMPLASPQEAPAPPPFGLLPGNNPGGVHNDAGVGVASAPVENDGLPPLRVPRIVRPGQPTPYASQALATPLDAVFRAFFGGGTRPPNRGSGR